MDGASQNESKETCKECGWTGKYLWHHLNRTKLPCKASYDIEALRKSSFDSTKEKKALRERKRYQNDPIRKKAAAKEYYRQNSDKKKDTMSTYNDNQRDSINKSMKEHYYANRSKTNQNRCPICKKVFSAVKHMIRHLNHIHSNKYPTLTCQICDKQIIYKDNLDRHMREVHDEEKSYECPRCPEDFSRLGNLQRHKVRGKHTFKSVCEYCDETFLFKGDTDFEKTMRKHYTINDPHRYPCKQLHDSCIQFHCKNEQKLSDEQREELLRKRLETNYCDDPEWLTENWEKILEQWRRELKEYRDKKEAKRRLQEERKNNSFFCKFCKTTCNGIFEREHCMWRVCKCPGCDIDGYTHECGRHECNKEDCKDRECKSKRNKTPYRTYTLYLWKKKVDRGDWKVDSTTYQKYIEQLQNHVQICQYKPGKPDKGGYCCGSLPEVCPNLIR